jgi:hypothetical protein
VQRRRTELQAAARTSGKSAEDSVKILDQMVEQFGAKAENASAALKRWDDAQGYTTESRRLATFTRAAGSQTDACFPGACAGK